MKPLSSTAQVQISLPQHRYYRGVILPSIREYCGYESDQLAHQALKAGFFAMHPDDPKLPSMANMSQDEASRFLAYALCQAAEMGLELQDPEPREAAPMKTTISREAGGDDCAFAIGPVGFVAPGCH